MEKQIEQTKFLIQRYDNYISGANSKGNFLLAFNTFLTGGIITNYCKFIELVNPGWGTTLLNIILALLVILTITTIIFIIKAVYPYLVSGNSTKDKYHSLIFFNSVSEFNNDTSFFDSLSKQSEDEVKLDLAKQAYQLAKGLKSKYRNLKWAMILIYIELFLILTILMIIIIF